MISRVAFTLAILLLGSTLALAQDPKPKTATAAFNDARDLLNAGNLEVAADILKDFLALAPTAQDYLDLEAKYGPTTFLKLRTIPRWYDDPKRDKEFKTAVLEKIVTGAVAAENALLKDPNRIAKFVKNLGGPPEEHNFAVAELRRSGDAVVPQMIESLRLDTDLDHRAGVLQAVTDLGPETIPGFLASAEGLRDEFKLPLLGAIARRPDLLTFAAYPDANLIPYLWYLAGLPKAEPNPVHDFAVTKLRELYGAAYDRRTPEDELTRAARPLYERKAKFLDVDTARNRVKFWTWDEKTLMPKAVETLQTQAEETLGLKYLRWAIERNAKYDPALDLFLAFATERAIERVKFADLATNDPNAFRLLAVAPSATILRLLEKSLAENRTALALGLVQALGDRADPAAGSSEVRPGGGTRQPVLVKALDYPDPRVQIAAALALLRIPNAKHGANARIVDILQRAIVPDAGAGSNRGKALVADPSTVRGDQVAKFLRAIGYQVEVFGNGRQLAHRIDRTADFDIILIDRHIVDPTLGDLLSMLRADPNSARRPLLVVASADVRAQLGLETLLARMAALIAATESADVEVPLIPNVDRRKPINEIESIRKAAVDLRDRRLRQLYDLRLARLQRLVESANFKQTDDLRRRLDLRMAQLTMAALIAEYDLTATSAPKMIRDFTQLTELIRRQTDLDYTVRNVDTATLAALILQLERVLTPELNEKYSAIRTRLDEDSLALAPDNPVDPATAAALARLTRTLPGVSVIREPYSKIGFEDDVAAAMPDAAQRPRDPGEKAGTAKAAVAALAKLADGSIPGYDVKPAAASLRAALANDDLVPAASDALAKIATPDVQTDLVRVAVDSARTAAVRSKAANAAMLSVQAFGKMASPEVLDALSKATATDAVLISELAVLNAIFNGKPGELAEALKAYQPTTGTAAKPKEAAPMPPPEEKKEEKKEEK